MHYNIQFNHLGMVNVLTVSKVLNIIISMTENGITRAELSRLTGFSKSTISQHVETLLKKNLIKESSGICGGRKNTHCLYFNVNCGYVLSVDVGATSMNIAICNLAGKPFATSFQERADIFSCTPRVILQEAITTAHALMRENNVDTDSLVGIGVGVPEPIEFNTSRPSQLSLMNKGWSNYPIRETFEEAFQKPVFVDNDVNIMAIAEYEKEQKNSDGNFLFIKLGTGIGCGIICKGEIYRGTNGCAGDIGHISVEGNNDLCPCGKHGCLENLAGGAALRNKVLQIAHSGKSDFLTKRLAADMEIDTRTLLEGVFAQDDACKELVYKTGLYIGEVLAKLVTFYNPSLIVLGGGLTNLGDLLFNAIREKIYLCSTTLATHDLHIKCSTLGDYAGVMGAAIMVRNRVFKEPMNNSLI